MTQDTIRDYWTGSSLHAEYWATTPSFKGGYQPHQQRWAKAHKSTARGLYRSQYLANTPIF